MGHPRRRVRFLLLAFLFVFSLFGVQLVKIQALDASSLAEAALSQRLSTVVVPAMRGTITDVNGAPLARSLERTNVTADQTAVPEYNKGGKDPAKVGVAGAAAVLAPLVGKSEADLTTILTGNRRFTYVAKNISPLVWRKISSLGIPGIYSEPTSVRVYPDTTLAAPLIGWVGSDGNGGGGIELMFNKQLEGKPGKTTYERAGDGRIIPTGEHKITAAVPGLDVRLTIDRDLQWEAENAIAAQVQKTDALSGTVVAMNVKTGQLAAVASYPSFDPNDIGKAQGSLQSRPFDEVFEPGSTAKVMTAAAALQEGVATPLTPVTVPNTLLRAGTTFHDAETHGTEHLTFAGVLAQSSNIGTMLVGEKVAPDLLRSYFAKFGLGQSTGIGFPGESAGLLAQAKDWSGSQRYNVMFGQGLSLTAIQAAGVFQTIADGGLRQPPSLVAGTQNADGTFTPAPPTKGVRVVSPQVASSVSQMLEGVVGDQGTAVQAEIPGYRVAGKTGTADRYDPSLGRYSGKTASFIGFAPADKPQFVVAVILQRPQKGYFGGSTAGPVFKQVMTYLLQKYQIPPTGTKPPALPLKAGDVASSNGR